MALTDQAQLARHEGFRDRCLVAAVQAAVAVVGEAASGDARVDDLRKTLGVNLLNDPLAYRELFSWAVAQNAAVTLDSNDGDIQFTVNSVWNDIAGV